MAVLTVYPQAGSGGPNVTCDFSLDYQPGNQAWADLIAGAGTNVDKTSSPSTYIISRGGTVSDTFSVCGRMILTFDTSALGANAVISSAVLSIFGSAKLNDLGSDTIHVTSATPASDNNGVAGDYAQVGSTSFGSISYAGFSTSAYNDFTLNASGISNINKTGVSRFGFKGGWDINASFGGVWSNGAYTYFQAHAADSTGTDNDPKLVITYSIPAGDINPLFLKSLT